MARAKEPRIDHWSLHPRRHFRDELIPGVKHPDWTASPYHGEALALGIQTEPKTGITAEFLWFESGLRVWRAVRPLPPQYEGS